MERDDVIEYSLYNHHSEEQGKVIRKKILKVTAILTLITFVEVLVGILFGKENVSAMAWEIIKWGYIVLTLVKAAYIVMVFMHMGDERKNFRYFILTPYFIFMTYLIFIVLNEGVSVGHIWSGMK